MDVSTSPLQPTPSPQRGFIAMFEENAAQREQDAAVSWIEQDAIHTLNWER